MEPFTAFPAQTRRQRACREASQPSPSWPRPARTAASALGSQSRALPPPRPPQLRDSEARRRRERREGFDIGALASLPVTGERQLATVWWGRSRGSPQLQSRTQNSEFCTVLPYQVQRGSPRSPRRVLSACAKCISGSAMRLSVCLDTRT